MKRWLSLRLFGVLLLAVLATLIAFPQGAKMIPWLGPKLASLSANLGLDLQGGIHLEYRVDTSQIPSEKKTEALQAALGVVERRVNAFGVGEPVVQLSRSGNEDRIIVELPGVKDVDEAKKMLRETPYLEFQEDNSEVMEKQLASMNESAKKEAQAILDRVRRGENFGEIAKKESQDPGSAEKGGDLDFASKGKFVKEFDDVAFNPDLKKETVWPKVVESPYGFHILKKTDERGEGEKKEVRISHILLMKQSLAMLPEAARFKPTGLSGKNLKDAFVDYGGNQGMGMPQVSLRFDTEGAKLFADLTKKNIGKQIAILLDGEIVSAPTVQAEIPNGQAVITGNYTLKEAKELVSRLNEGALPAPITLIGQQSVSASLGEASLKKSLTAGVVGVGAVIVFVIAYYRFFGLIASIALLLYTGLLFAIFKLSSLTPFPITLSLAGIAGFVLSIGMAVDANILIFERTWEEIKNGKHLTKAIDEGFRRAWPSIRDGNYSTLLTCLILMWLGTGFVKGFALVLLLGVLFSMFTAIILTRVLLDATIGSWAERHLFLLVPKRKRYEAEKTKESPTLVS
ncbi:MAG: protein translocase subunit SecD [Candidatus Moraniibacteriota bacterium]|nr:MAG: protein translocase subunit SecD [Candidatus Moranbacteria bacterium]